MDEAQDPSSFFIPRTPLWNAGIHLWLRLQPLYQRSFMAMKKGIHTITPQLGEPHGENPHVLRAQATRCTTP